MLSEKYDLVIVGRGAAAFSAAIRASEITSGQARIAMVGNGPLGGTCVNTGCVPSKLLISISNSFQNSLKPRYPGLPSVERPPETEVIMDFIRESVHGERKKKYEDVVESYENIDLYTGTAVFTGEKEILVDSSHSLFGYNVLIATGSRPYVPGIKGLNETSYITTDSVWELKHVPASIAILGGGAVGVEIGQALSRLGSEVHIIEVSNQILPGIPADMASIIERSLREDGMVINTSTSVDEVSGGEGKKYLKLNGTNINDTLEVEEILVATGRAPNIDLALEKTGVKYSKRGIAVDEYLRTSNRKIYAAGDVVDQKYKLETLAAREGFISAENMFNHAMRTIDIFNVPFAVFCSPGYASVGYTQDEATKAGIKTEARRISTKDVASERIHANREGIINIVAEADTKEIVGVQIVAENAPELINEASAILSKRFKTDDLINTVHVFPTENEGLKLATQSFSRDITMMSCCME
ncbi:mercuric reductase [Thermoplasma volcanium GSS1]|uniref:Mercuric reductase n=1 Tax=Thermoplasma volcanium (strain ATCC 51530 / DSM 4299 / JCM 9571 / NBRC 15438 / GSS1) TaxID=273116 RepID=Q97C54_THEVO|nr:mercury(II) reductase [Thermoplasma volcanium]BAB59393.1 mercuric reductase [Thermoplasma volcanium GSS1]